jgi:hypothetical protein
MVVHLGDAKATKGWKVERLSRRNLSQPFPTFFQPLPTFANLLGKVASPWSAATFANLLQPFPTFSTFPNLFQKG